MEITEAQALDCFRSNDLIGIGMEADAVRQRLHPEQVATYAVTHSITLKQPEELLYSSIAEAAAAGVTTVQLTPSEGSRQESDRSAMNLKSLELLLTGMRAQNSSMRLYALSTEQVAALSDQAGVSLREALARLRGAGLDAISGDDLYAAEADRTCLSPERWIEVHRMAHGAGVLSTAGLVFGMGESPEQRVKCLSMISRLQHETAGFISFTPWSYKPKTERSEFEEPTAVEYLRTLAISRMFLDNVDNIESSCVAQGLKVVQMGLRFGANDAGSITTPEPDMRASTFTEEDLRRVIRDAGFTPVERDALYCTVFLAN